MYIYTYIYVCLLFIVLPYIYISMCTYICFMIYGFVCLAVLEYCFKLTNVATARSMIVA